MSFWLRLLRRRPAWKLTIFQPEGGSHTGRYLLLRADDRRDPYDVPRYILLARRPGELSRAVHRVGLPFDEQPPRLLDCVEDPEVVVLYGDFLLIWSIDGGQTIREVPDEPEGVFRQDRFGCLRIERAQLRGGNLFVSMAMGRLYMLAPPKRNGLTTDLRNEVDRVASGSKQLWRVPLDGGSRAELVDPPSEPTDPPVEGDEFVKVRRSRLLMRASIDSPWVERRVMDLLQARVLRRERTPGSAADRQRKRRRR